MGDYLKIIESNKKKLIPFIRDKCFVSDTQLSMMLHAIGADSTKARKYRDKYYYHAYRNGYDAGGDDVQEWEKLVKLGIASKNRVYHVTISGINLLEVLTNSVIYLCDCVGDAKSKVLTTLIQDACYCGYGCWNPTPIKNIARRIHAPEKVVRECLAILESEELVKKTYNGGCDDEGYPYCYHGWVLAKKAYELDEYKQAWKEECRKIEESVNRDCKEERGE